MASGKKILKEFNQEQSAQKVLRQFRVVISSVRRHYQLMEKRSGIGGAQIWALNTIAQTPGIGINRLSSVMDIHQSTASNLVRALVEQGLIQSEKSVHDKRATELYPLPAGLKILKKVPGPVTGLLPHALSKLSNSDLVDLERSLSKLVSQLNIDEKSAHTPIALM